MARLIIQEYSMYIASTTNDFIRGIASRIPGEHLGWSSKIDESSRSLEQLGAWSGPGFSSVDPLHPPTSSLRSERSVDGSCEIIRVSLGWPYTAY